MKYLTHIRTIAVTFILIAATLLPATAQTIIRRVTMTGNTSADGSTWATAMTLQAALMASTTVGDQIWIQAGTYKPGPADDGDDATDERAATFTILVGVRVYGGFVGDEPADFDPATTPRMGAATILSGRSGGR